MNVKEQKFVCDLISLVADAVATDTISEAEDYLVDNYQGVQDPVLEHTFDVLSQVFNKQTSI